MNDNDILRIACEAGAELYADTLIVNGKDAHDFIKRFAALVASAEREECAKVCEYRAMALDYSGNKYVRDRAALDCAAAIRARENKS